MREPWARDSSLKRSSDAFQEPPHGSNSRSATHCAGGQADEIANAKNGVSGPGLKARAVRLLSVREHSRQELSRKLTPHAPDTDSLESVLDELEREGWQSDERFAQSFEHSQSSRFGSRRVANAMRERGLDNELIQESLDRLKATEPERAFQVWQKKFGQKGLPQDAKEYARQARFLAGRGFGADTVSRILSGRYDPQD